MLIKNPYINMNDIQLIEGICLHNASNKNQRASQANWLEITQLHS